MEESPKKEDLSEIPESEDADNNPLSTLNDSNTVLESISDQYKGILLDLHNTMGDNLEEALGEQSLMLESEHPNDISSTNLFETGDMSDATNAVVNDDSETNIPFTEYSDDIGNSNNCVLPTAVINSSDTALEGEDANWTAFSAGLQIPESNGVDDGYNSFGDQTLSESVSSEQAPITSNTFQKNKILDFKSIIGTFKIFVSNLPPDMTNEELFKLFEIYGNVLECEVFQHKNYAFVHMDSEISGGKAISGTNGRILNGSKIRVQRSTSFPVRTGLQEVKTFKLYINHLNEGVTKDYIKQLLGTYGRIVEIEIYRNNSAFVHMEEETAARKIMRELNGQVLPETGERPHVTESKNPEGPRLPTITLEVKNIGKQVTAEMIRSLFQPYGLVVKTSIVDSNFDMLRKAVVHLEQLGDIRSAIKDLCDYELDGQKLIVEPVLESKHSETNNKVFSKGGPLLTTPVQGYGHGYHDYGPPPGSFYPPNYGQSPGSFGFDRYTPQPFTRGGMFNRRGGPFPRGRGNFPIRGGFKTPTTRNFQLIPMPSMYDLQRMPRGKAGGNRGARGRGRGFAPNYAGGPPKRPYENSGFDQDTYDFDDYYQDPAAASSRQHLNSLEEEYMEFQEATGSIPQPPPQKKWKPISFLNNGNKPPPLMGYELEPPNPEEIPTQVPYNPYPYPSLNLPLGEREYYSNLNQNPGFQTQSNQQPYQMYLQQQGHQPNSETQQFQQDSANYFVHDQIPSTSTIHSNFDGSSTVYPNYYQNLQGVDESGFNAVPFDYTNIRKGNRQAQQGQDSQQIFPPGVDPADYPNLKPGSKVYVNKNGKVMVRGCRKKVKPRHPGLGSKDKNGDDNSISANQVPVGGGTLTNQVQVGGTSSFSSFYNSQKKFKSKDQVKEENQEYSEWLEKKPWLYEIIPGIVKAQAK